jgi:hypothetical protein
MNEHASPLRFTFCAACSALMLVSGAESHVCQPRAHDSVVACDIEAPALLHIHQGGSPEPSQLRSEPVAITTSTAPPPAPPNVGRPLGIRGPGGGPPGIGGPGGSFPGRL